MKLYSYWRSGTSYRVRLALAIKGGDAEIVPVNLLEGEQGKEPFLSKNAQGLVPTLELDDGTLFSQSPAIIEYLEEELSGPRLLPQDPVRRAKARQLAAIIGCDIHPIQNLRILKYLQDPLGHSREDAFAWAAHWITTGFDAFLEERRRAGAEGRFGLGDAPSVVDCYLLPQIYAGRRFGVDFGTFPELNAIEEEVLSLPALAAAHPDVQPDARPGS